ncbi:MAG TPA: hypothetical protein VFL83_07475 [Anaeromyxobacter sp.]|nr:hypothetical protein [Anaeromyxobacter sp.]
MGAALTVVDATPTGRKLSSFRLELASERITVRELIRRRVLHEVAERAQAGRQPRIAPAPVEARLNPPPRPKPLDPEAECAAALDAFGRNGFFVLVGDRQVEDLDEEIVVVGDTEVRFVKLVPLVGG